MNTPNTKPLISVLAMSLLAVVLLTVGCERRDTTTPTPPPVGSTTTPQGDSTMPASPPASAVTR